MTIFATLYRVFSPAISSIIRLTFDAAEQLRRWRDVSRQRKQLMDLDDRLLRDVGITREDALKESERPFWDDRSAQDRYGHRFYGVLARLQPRDG